MIVLGIETSTVVGSVAVVKGNAFGGEICLNGGKKHSEQLLRSIEILLETLGLPVGSLEGIAVGLGPGSFTGLRVGLSTAKGLAMALEITVVGIGSLDSLAHSVSFWNGLVCAMNDARGEKVYGALYKVADGMVERHCEEGLKDLEPWISEFSGPVLFVGEASVKYRDRIRSVLGNSAKFLPIDCSYPRASFVARAGLQRLQKGEVDSLEALAPRYVQEPKAERELREKAAGS